MIIFSNGHISHGIDMTLSISYGPDETRWKTEFTDTGLTRRLIRYYGDYEEVDSFGPQPSIPVTATTTTRR